MKAKVIEKILLELTPTNAGYGLVTINAGGKSFTYNCHEGDDEWEVNSEDDTLVLTNGTGTHWISCDAVTSIEI